MFTSTQLMHSQSMLNLFFLFRACAYDLFSVHIFQHPYFSLHRNVTTIRRRAILVSGDVRFQDGDAFDLGKLGGGTFSLIFFYFLSMSALALAILQ